MLNNAPFDSLLLQPTVDAGLPSVETLPAEGGESALEASPVGVELPVLESAPEPVAEVITAPEPEPVEPPTAALAIGSAYGSNESIVRIPELIVRARKLGYKALGMADVMSVAGVAEFVAECRQAGVRSLVGAVLRLAPFPAEGFVWRLGRVRVFAQTERGWLRILSLLAKAAERSPGELQTQHLSYEDLLENPDGLVVLMGEEQSELARLLMAGELEIARQITTRCRETLEPGQLYIALPSPALHPELCAKLYNFAAEEALPLCALPMVRCTLPEEDAAYRILHDKSASRQETPGARSMEQYLRPESQREHLKSPADLHIEYATYPQALKGLEALERGLHFEFRQLANAFPKNNFARGVDADSFIWNSCFSEAQVCYADSPVPWRERLNDEFSLLCEQGIPNGLIWVLRLLEEFQTAGIFYGPGLGSYTTSLVCSLLSITGIDPFQLGTHPLTLNDVSRQMTIRVAPHQRARAEQVLQELLGRNCFTPHRWRESTLEEARVQAADLLGLSTELRDTLLNTRNWELYAGRERLSPAGQEPSAQWLFNDPRTLAWLCRKLKGLPKSPEPEVGVHGLAESQSVIPLFVTTPNTGQKSEKTSREVRHSHWSSAQCAALGAGVIRLVEEPALELLAVATHWIRLEGHDQFTPEDALNRQSARIWDALQTDSMRGIPFLEAPGFRIFVGQKRPRTLGQLIAALKDWDEAHGLYTVESELVERAMLALLCLAVKLEHPIAFAAGLLTMISGDPKRLQAHIHEQLLLGREIRPLDINCSSPWWSPEGNALRAGLCQVRALDSDALSEIELVRQELAYGNLRDLMQRTDASALSAEQVEALIHAGAFDSLEHNRTQLIQHFQRLRPLLRPKTLPRSATRFEEFFNPSTTSILHQHTQILELGPVYKNAAAEITAEQQLQQERSATSVYLSVSPCYFFADLLREARILTTLPAKRKTHRPIISLIGPLTSIDPCPPRSDVFAYAEIGTSLVRINQQQWHQLHDTFAETDLVLVTGPLHEKLICLETLRIDHPESAQRHSIEAEALRLQPFTFQPAQAKALLELFKAYPGSTAVQWPWLDAKPPRLQQKLTARRITWCPALEVELRSILKDGEWALHSTRAFTATESPDLEPTGTG